MYQYPVLYSVLPVVLYRTRTTVIVLWIFGMPGNTCESINMLVLTFSTITGHCCDVRRTLRYLQYRNCILVISPLLTYCNVGYFSTYLPPQIRGSYKILSYEYDTRTLERESSKVYLRVEITVVSMLHKK